MKIIKLLTLIPLLFVLNTGIVFATQLSVDLTPGGSIDNIFTANVGGSFDVDIILNDAVDFAGFQFDLEFDDTILTATSITSADVFGLDTFLLDDTISSNSVSFSEVSFALTGLNIDTSSVIATISFNSIASGTSSLSLTNIILTDSLGGELLSVNLASGDITVVPAPTSFWLFFTGIMGFFSMVKRKN